MPKNKNAGRVTSHRKKREADKSRSWQRSRKGYDASYFARKHGMTADEARRTAARIGNDNTGARTRVRKHVDPDDAPELTEGFFERADWYKDDKLIRRGRPRSLHPKQQVTLRLDADVVEHFKASGPGWQTRANAALRHAAKLDRIAKRRST